jgi:hypothetical protein
MTTYIAQFHTDADWAERTFDANTPEQALTLAQVFYDEHTEDLKFESYNSGMPVNEIEIADGEGNRLAVWRDDDLRLRLAAPDLRDALKAQSDAAQTVIDAWETGDLAGAVRTLDASIQLARAALAKAKPLASALVLCGH